MMFQYSVPFCASAIDAVASYFLEARWLSIFQQISANSSHTSFLMFPFHQVKLRWNERLSWSVINDWCTWWAFQCSYQYIVLWAGVFTIFLKWWLIFSTYSIHQLVYHPIVVRYWLRSIKFDLKLVIEPVFHRHQRKVLVQNWSKMIQFSWLAKKQLKNFCFMFLSSFQNIFLLSKSSKYNKVYDVNYMQFPFSFSYFFSVSS